MGSGHGAHGAHDGDGAHVDVLVVELGGTPVGVVADRVVEVHQVVLPTPLPGAPAFVEGAVNLHGEVVPVTDLRRHLGLAARPLDPDDHLVVATVKGRPVAFRVDRATALTTVAAGDLVPAGGVAPSAPHLAGVATTVDGLLLIHDLDALLSADDVARTDRLLAGAGGRGAPVR